MLKKIFSAVIYILIFQFHSIAQVNNVLLKNVQAKLDKVTDYEAEGKMKTNVAFLKIPVANIKLLSLIHI